VKNSLSEISFSDRVKYQASFEKWCQAIGRMSKEKYSVAPVFATSIIWMQASKSGRELVRRLYEIISKGEADE